MKSLPSWIQPIEHQLKEVLDFPETSFSETFPLEELSAFISSHLNITPLSIALHTKEWKTTDSIFSGLGTSPISISFQASPLNGDCFWVIPYEDLETFISWLKDKNEKTFELNNPELLKGIYRYALLVAFEGISQTDLFKKLSLKFTKDVKLEEKYYSTDVSISHGETQIWGRFLMSAKFKDSFMNFFSKDSLSLFDLAKQFPNLKIPLSIANGCLELTKDEIDSLEEGDYLIVDNAFFKPSDQKGSLKVLLKEIPLFQIKLKDGKFKILDFIYAFEEAKAHAE
jgi:flagellar motor switch protein FliN/FliY